MKTPHTTSPTERRARADAISAVQQAVQEAMDRRDNGGETGH
ncbi:MAG TPA: hypothetical protein VFV76_07785 [Actinomycetes bacterium]|nr:hypothetical protein [Actinomycetes bacterium]